MVATACKSCPSNGQQRDSLKVSSGQSVTKPYARQSNGPMEILGLTELSPCWRPLLKARTSHIPVQWTTGPRAIPTWPKNTSVSVSNAPAESPILGTASTATVYHKAIKAMRWVLLLLASGMTPSEIASATASPNDHDSHFLSLRTDASFNLHFVHVIKTVTLREGQTATTLADIVTRGLS